MNVRKTMSNMKHSVARLAGSALAFLGAGFSTAVYAVNDLPGGPAVRQLNMHPAVTKIAQEQHWLHWFMMIVCIVIFVAVFSVMFYSIWKHRKSVGHKAANFPESVAVEIAWTIVPIVILVFIGAFSLPVLFEQQEIPEADLTIKVTGNQWFWSYEYVDDGVAFDSYMIGYGEGNLNPDISLALAEAGYTDNEFLLATDNAVVVPVGATVVMQLTGSQVIHAWAVPAFGVMQSAVPGRLSQLWFAAEQEGIYFGQCTSLCGKDHAYMPITVKVVSQAEYDLWLAGAKEEFPAS